MSCPFTTIVINLKSRPDRLEHFSREWSFLQNVQVSPGIVHDLPHTGCGLAHIAAIRKGLKKSEWCLVLEDDAVLNCSIADFYEYIDIAQKMLPLWQAVNLGALSHLHFDRPELVTVLNEHFFQVSRTKSLRSCTAMLWSRKALPFIDQYEQVLLKGHIFPIDRMLFSWIYPWIVNIEGEGNESSSGMRFEAPQVIVSRECLVTQRVNVLSNNTGLLSTDLRDDYLETLFQAGLTGEKDSATISDS